jgi:hypothetical protein
LFVPDLARFPAPAPPGKLLQAERQPRDSTKGLAIMDLPEDQQQLRERFVIALIEATYPLQKGAADPEVNLELLIQAADLLKQHLERELEELRAEQTE